MHELSHWIGHESRLNRDLLHPFGSEGYAREELRDEIASMLLGDELRTGHDPSQHTSYIKSWIRVLENDPLEIFRAAADAEKIQSHLLALTQTLEQTPLIMDEKPEDIPLMQQPLSENTRLVIPYEQKEQAKAIAGKLEDGRPAIVWDRTEKCWYAREGAPLDRLSAWLPSNQNAQPATNITEEFKDTLLSVGCIVSSNHPIMDGNTHRIAVEGDKKGEKSGFYVAHTDGLPSRLYEK
ncbi:zincin-like metallopeptidase domain-containing protein [Legionella sp. CNM-4043-24]|uniref:zincin-like metallopeptidase domain-containing protein n=1 Tax=Legionella sp. CNM-4043-24 TaxID=3421646 RepID=UPI00403A8348